MATLPKTPCPVCRNKEHTQLSSPCSSASDGYITVELWLCELNHKVFKIRDFKTGKLGVNINKMNNIPNYDFHQQSLLLRQKAYNLSKCNYYASEIYKKYKKPQSATKKMRHVSTRNMKFIKN